ncbi:hypothetical protein P43SY_011667 [Pythium insidiosum]|uniref:Uncharacterized protein n=1 Tax=Pythium insidiosum TaxID=114742 RepID=A0AAD5LNT0_PYTIN|nr:hypothetical protein P43SY_011667 [Pythium insidiosum]
MMNEMMETALLHNLVLTCAVQADQSRQCPELALRVDNRSQISLSDVALSVILESESAGERVVDQTLLADVGALSSQELLIPLDAAAIGLKGRVELAFASPGTKQSKQYRSRRQQTL